MNWPRKSSVKLVATAMLRMVCASIVLLAVSCASNTSQNVSVQPMVYSNGTVPVRGVVTQFTNSDFTLDAGIGRLVLRYDGSTVAMRISRVPGAVSVNDFKSGMEVLVYYDPTSNLSADVEFLPTPLAIPASGAIAQIASPTIMLNTAAGSKTLRLIAGVVVIKNDGSAGTINDLAAGINIMAYYYPQTNTVIVAEIQ